MRDPRSPLLPLVSSTELMESMATSPRRRLIPLRKGNREGNNEGGHSGNGSTAATCSGTAKAVAPVRQIKFNFAVLPDGVISLLFTAAAALHGKADVMMKSRR